MNVEKIDLSKIEIDNEIYPRKNLSQKTIKDYTEHIFFEIEQNEGKKEIFPPVELQQIYEFDDKGKRIDKIICLDGWHRVFAYREYNELKGVEPIKEIPFLYWNPEPLNKIPNLQALMTESAIKNILHGDRLDTKDLQDVLIKIVKIVPLEDLTGLVDRFAKTFGKSKGRISQLVGPEIDRRKMSRDSIVYKLSLLGWTQKEIGETIGVSEEAVQIILKKFNIKLFKDEFSRGDNVADIAKNNQTDQATAWAILLQGKEDLERFKLFGDSEYSDESPMSFNVWNFAKPDERLGQEHLGRIAGQIALNVIYYFTELSDQSIPLIVDPMAGGGSTIDACLVMGRKCRAYDIEPSRKDIVEQDIRKGYNSRAKNADLVFLDPPYWDMLKYSDKSISSKSLQDFYKDIDQISKATYETLKPKGLAAFITCDLTRDNPFQCLSHECAKIFEKNGFKITHRISVPYPSSVGDKFEVVTAWKNKKMLGRDRVLYVFQKL